MKNCILQSNGRCKITTEKSDGKCEYNIKTKRCSRKKIIKEKSKTKESKKSKKSETKEIMYYEPKKRYDILNSNVLFNDTEFRVDSKTYEIKYPEVMTNKTKCKSKQSEYFFNCFRKIGSGSFATFYSPIINDYFGIRKVNIDKQ